MRKRVMALLWLGVIPAQLAPAALAQPPAQPQSTKLLERSWQRLDAQLRALDQLLPSEPEPPVGDVLSTPELPANLIRANQPATGPIQPADTVAGPPLDLPTPQQLQAGGVASLSLEQALAIAFANSATLQAQREQVAAALARVQAAMGSYWPTISAFATGGYEGARSTTTSKKPNDNLGFGPLFDPAGLLSPSPSGGAPVPTAGPFYVPNGGSVAATSGEWGVEGSLQLNYALLDFARTPSVRAARASLEQQRNTYANQLRSLQLQVSEAYYQLQQDEQLVRVYDANLRNDLVILQDTLDLKQAGLVPRLDVLRRRAIQAADEETLIQSLADRAVARRQLAVLLNLPASVTPSPSDPIVVQPRWPLDLEASLLAAYRGNPELEAILATRTALAQQSQATAAGLLPKLSLFASGGGSSSQTSLGDFTLGGGGCCGSTALPLSTSNGWDWSVGLTFTWLLFDAGTTAGQARALTKQAAATAQQYAASRNDIRLRMEQAFFNHEASLAKLSSARRGVAAALEAFRDVRLRYLTGLDNELNLSNTQDRLINSLVRRLNATVGVNITYAKLLKELLPMPRDPNLPIQPQLQLSSSPITQP
ncbi:TolC family protein [Cyanobium sp. T1G-Tous]|uniref:TolC family protein n=1 Tax=unclassified Cyanobium TaxID=2627006 RepID=UPI0020CD1DCD|nr:MULTISPECIES: TolC family protein [unclassified Cyanobium]MCP9777280.1 TolC family protein [Cyanobium sp. Tous-M-B4]MCP9802335.1 TolC family protein [Cyanobium sp. T1G-Tous]MCP9875653.1 TolC family protein [Cyanobium sp. A2C-AMD]